MWRLYRILLDPDPAPEVKTGGGGDPPKPADNADLAKAVQGLISRHGSAESVVRVLLEENHSHRDKIRDLQAAAPKQGSMVLSEEEAKQWSSYRELGAPADVRKTLAAGTQAQTEVAGFLKEKLSASVAKLEGLGWNAEVLHSLAKDLTLEIVEVADPKDNKVVRAKAFVKDGDKSTPIEEYAAKHWAAFMPALKPATTKNGFVGTDTRNGVPAPAPSTGRPPTLYKGKNPF